MGAVLAAFLPLLIQYGPKAIEELVLMVEDIKALYADGHVPTPEELARLEARAQDAHARLQAM